MKNYNPDPPPVPPRTQRAIRIGMLVTVLAIWEWYGSLVNPAMLAGPRAIGAALYDQVFIEPVLPRALIEMNVPLFVGFSSAIVVGILTGVVMGRWQPVRMALSPYLAFLYALPGITLIPVLILWLGLGSSLAIALVFIAGVLPIAINTAIGVVEVDKGLHDVARSGCATPQQEIRTVLLPGTLPFILTGIQTGLAQAIIAIIVVELTAVLRGMGGLIQFYANSFQTANMMAPILIVGLESVGLVALMKSAKRRFAPWSETAS